MPSLFNYKGIITMKIKVASILNIMESTGSLNFDLPMEKEGFFKIAEGMIDPMMMAQMAGMPQMQDPQMANIPPEAMAAMQQQMGGIPQMGGMQGQAMPGQMDAAMAQNQVAPDMNPMMPNDTTSTIVGETISNKDIESLVKIINIISTLKNQYDSMKKDQIEMLKTQMGMGSAPKQQ